MDGIPCDLRIGSRRARFDFNIIGHSSHPVDAFRSLLRRIFLPIAVHEARKRHHPFFDCYGDVAAWLVSPPNCEQFYCGKKQWLLCDGAEIMAGDLI
jgi:hypothetical protein